MLAGIAWRNLWRQPYRTALSVGSIALASVIMIFLLALQRGSYAAIEEHVLRLMDGFAQLQPVGYADDPDLRTGIAAPGALMARIQAVTGVSASAPRASTFAILSNGPRSYGGQVVGVQPEAERRISVIPGTLVSGRFLRAQDTASAVVGARLARNLGLAVGSRLTLLGSARDGSIAADVLQVQGIFATGVPQLDREVVEIPLARFQSDFAMGDRANVIAVIGRSLADIDAHLPELRAIARGTGLVVRDWTALEPALHDAILLDVSISLLFYLSLLAVVIFITVNTLLMSVLERTREFGMLLAVGMRPAQIGCMIWLEFAFLATVGAAAGIVAGSALTAWLSVRGIGFSGAEAMFAQWHLPAALHPQLDAWSALSGPLAIAAAALAAGAVPYTKVRRLEPASAMRAA